MDSGERTRIDASARPQLTVSESVGMIVVHGIGEQKRGDHLEEVVRPFVEGLGDDDHNRSGKRVVVWPPEVGDAPAKVRIDVGWEEGGRSHLTKIIVHEVHWADINEPNSLGKGLRFWVWGLSAWLTPGKFDIGRDGVFHRTMATPIFPDRDPTKQLMFRDRVQLFFVGWLFLLAAPIIVVADFFAKRVFNTTLPASLQTIVSYVSAVKLYTQERRAGPGLLDSCNQPPRFTIRRRMAAAMVEAATAGYDRWFIVAHSQGTVVAFNGLMASGRVWPNYLDAAALAALCRERMAGPWRDERDGPALAAVLADRSFAPPIPPARGEDDSVVYRERLLDRFRGLLTYGSPLDKFAAIWPPTVALNRQTRVFPDGSEWVNVWDPTDPVGGALDAFDPDQVNRDGPPPGWVGPGSGQILRPINIPCRASGAFLASHLAYLRGFGGGTQLLSAWAADWIMGRARAQDLVSRLEEKRQLVGPRATDIMQQAEVSAAAARRRKLLSFCGLLATLPFVLWGWGQIGAFLRRSAPSYLPEWLAHAAAAVTFPVVWVYDRIAAMFPRACAQIVVPLCLDQLAAAAIMSALVVLAMGPLGRWTTPLDPRDQRSEKGSRVSVFRSDMERLKALFSRSPPG